jgi:hypothetical protein
MIRILAVPCVVVALGACTVAECHAPHYRQGSTVFDSKSETVTNISIRFQDFTPSKLSCLAKNLKDRYRGRNSVTVSIFSSHEAATHSTGVLPPEATKTDHEMFAQLHAYYLFDAEKHYDYVVLMPDPTIGDPSAATNTKIDLSKSTVPACKLQIDDRCLLAFDYIGLLSGKDPGTVTLTAQIERNGSVTGVRVVDADLNPSSQQHALADLALQNLKSWRFERSRHTDALRIVYSVEHVNTPLEHGVDVEFMLPDRVDVRIGPLLLSH